uniref:Uncharacterized protein n=2 Tax=Ursus TaxID=9639 RepID=A0A452UTA8_URSMA
MAPPAPSGSCSRSRRIAAQCHTACTMLKGLDSLSLGTKGLPKVTHEPPTTEGQDGLYRLLCGQEQQGRSVKDSVISEVIFYTEAPQGPSIVQGGWPGP